MKRLLPIFLICSLLVPLGSNAAIAWDAADSNNVTTATSVTYGMTVGAGSNLALFVGLATDAANVTGCTYNSVAMTQIGISDSAAGKAYLFYLLNPATGTNNVVCSASATTDFYPTASSYTGVNQSMTYTGGSPTDAVDTTVLAGGGTSSLKTVTSIQDNSWAIAMYTHQRTITVGLGTQRATGNTTDTRAQLVDTGTASTTAGIMSINGTHSAAGVSIAAIIASFSPAVAGPAADSVQDSVIIFE